MKLDHVDMSRNFTKRGLSDFSKGLIELLQTKRLEDITVGELCDKCSYPRSTFYNYFEDIYALMDYCWISASDEIKIDDFQDITHEVRTLTLFDRVYTYMDHNRTLIDRLMKYNSEDGVMVRSMSRYMKGIICRMVTECPASDKYPIPYDMVVEHYTNTILLIIEQCFIKNKKISREDALTYLDFLLGALERESTRK